MKNLINQIHRWNIPWLQRIIEFMIAPISAIGEIALLMEKLATSMSCIYIDGEMCEQLDGSWYFAPGCSSKKKPFSPASVWVNMMAKIEEKNAEETQKEKAEKALNFALPEVTGTQQIADFIEKHYEERHTIPFEAYSGQLELPDRDLLPFGAIVLESKKMPALPEDYAQAWLTEITNKGIGNGISILIFVGIVSGLPGAMTNILNKLITVKNSTYFIF